MLIQLLADTPSSWIIPYREELYQKIIALGHECIKVDSHDEIKQGEVLVLLSCEQKLKDLTLNKHNLVIHESALPQGKGWSPITWQVLEGKNSIPITLFEATNSIDAGNIYLQDTIELKGDELIDKIKAKQGEKTIDLVMSFIKNYSTIEEKPQIGKESFYKKRTALNSELDINKTISEQFNLLRVCDNERYPAFFVKEGIKYTIKIFTENA